MFPCRTLLTLCTALVVLPGQARLTAQIPGPQPGVQPGVQPGIQPGPQAGAQPAPTSPYHLIPLPPHAPITPGQITLIGLESRFAADVAARGGSAFASWFAEDAVTLSNGQPAVRGRAAIAAAATWDPAVYTLTWVAEGADMAPSNDMGYTWGHYLGRSKSKSGGETRQTGRYITIWKKQTDGQWKVALEASADDPPGTPPLALP